MLHSNKIKTLLVILTSSFLFSCDKEVETIVETKTIRDTIRIIDTLNIDRPINFKATKGVYGSRITLSWTPMPLAQKYQIWKFNGSTQKYDLFKELADTTFDDANISKALTKNFYKVRTFNSTSVYSRFSDADFGYTSGLNYYRASFFGSEGTGPTQFNFTMHIEVDKAGNIYVSDEGANRVLKFDPAGKFLEQFYTGSGARAIAFLPNGNYIATRTQSNSYVQIFNANKQLIREWGTYGTGDSNFGNIECLTLDDEQNIWIVDGVNHRVKKYDINGNLLLKFGQQGSGNGDFNAPFGICYLNNKIYVSDTRNNRVEVFDKAGKFLKIFPVKGYIHGMRTDGTNLFLANSPGYVIKTDESGDVQEKIGEGTFNNLVDMAIGPNGEVITCDVYGRRISIFKKG
ncbi:NHL repeat-containing protein [Pedobacter sp. Leaf170]|uniref:NHL repeat-containing protein n=1 Tax=Pedobacter sp. Leaf170 TaxID=2876558 RepID=UPI001E52E98F|nr:NHL repeat-containing protein [Pedobacter sp. Leaf170]